MQALACAQHLDPAEPDEDRGHNRAQARVGPLSLRGGVLLPFCRPPRRRGSIRGQHRHDPAHKPRSFAAGPGMKATPATPHAGFWSSPIYR